MHEARAEPVTRSLAIRALSRRLPVGADVVGLETVHFRVWAPRRRRVDVAVESGSGDVVRTVPLSREDGGYFTGTGDIGPGTLYRYVLDGDERTGVDCRGSAPLLRPNE